MVTCDMKITELLTTELSKTKKKSLCVQKVSTWKFEHNKIKLGCWVYQYEMSKH